MRIVIAAAIAAVLCTTTAQAQMLAPKKTLYERLGGLPAITAVVDDFVGNVARDRRINRDVALKILLPQFADDPDRLARFRREAQVLAAINHPGIASIYGLAEQDGVRALVLEFPEIQFISAQSGRNDSGTDPFPPSRLEIMIRPKLREQWTRFTSKRELMAALGARLRELNL